MVHDNNDNRTRGAEIIAAVERSLFDESMMREAARAQLVLLHFQGPGQDQAPPMKWDLFFGAANGAANKPSLF